MTPALQCNFNCLFCWRFHGIIPFKEPKKWDAPERILDGCFKAQKELLSGFKGFSKVSIKMFEEAIKPKHLAISLDGEPTFYPMLSELIEEATRRKLTTFLVTNGTMPQRLKNLEKEPTNLYISLCAPDKETYEKVNVPLISNGWEKINESLELMKSFNCTTVIRHTLVKNFNLEHPEKYAKLISKAEPDFIEPKAFFHVGEAQKRLPRETMPSMDDIRKFAQKLSEFTGYRIKDEDIASRVVLLARS
jgi:tRNA wybutosine-synthesizing protein 1